MKSINDNKRYPGRKDKFEEMLKKVSDALQLTNPKPESINIYGITNCIRMNINSTHSIHADLNLEDNNEAFAELASFCSILSKPVYIGKTSDDTLLKRFNSHRKKYERISKKGDESENDDPFTREGEFPEKLVRRNIEFRNLIFTCVPISKKEQEDYIEEVEKLLHSISNPSLSVKYD